MRQKMNSATVITMSAALCDDVYGIIIWHAPVFSRVSAAIRAIYAADMHDYDDHWRKLLTYEREITATAVYVNMKQTSWLSSCMIHGDGQDRHRTDHKYKISCYHGIDTARDVVHVNVRTGGGILSTIKITSSGGVSYINSDQSDQHCELLKTIGGWVTNDTWPILLKYTRDSVGAFYQLRHDIITAPPPFLRKIPSQLLALIDQHRRFKLAE